MGLCGFVVYTFAITSLLLFCAFRCTDGRSPNFKRCTCETVDFWLTRKTNGFPKLLSYKETVFNSHEDLLSGNTYTILRLWVPKHCKILPDTAGILQGNAELYKQDPFDHSVQVRLKGYFSEQCLSLKFKCKIKTLCLGVNTENQDAGKSTQRKLLMFEPHSSEEMLHQPYSVLLSVVVFCSMIVLIALCGKSEKNSQERVARDSSGVKIVSSKEVKSLPRQQQEKDTETKPKVIEIKVESDLPTDKNSNNSSQIAGDVDLSSVVVLGGNVKNDDTADGAVFAREERGSSEEMKSEEDDEGKEWEKVEKVETKSEAKGNSSGRKTSDADSEIHDGKKQNDGKRKEKEEKRKEKEREKEIKKKDRTKDTRSKRSHNDPSESTEPKTSGFSKLRLSLKTKPNESNSEKTKKEKKKSKKSDSDSPLESPPPFAGDRRSFVNRELPKRPSEELEDAKRPAYESDHDDNYETVVTTKIPTAKEQKKLEVPTFDNRESGSYDNDSSLYDTPEEQEVKPSLQDAPSDEEPEDMYELVITKSPSKTQSSAIIPFIPAPGFYETVETRSTRDSKQSVTPDLYESVEGAYEEPSLRRQRSFSDILPTSTSPSTDAQHKSNSLGRQDVPTPPPWDNFKLAAQAHEHRKSDIEPYTVTVKKGDQIVQETSSSDYPKSSSYSAGHETKLSPDEIAKLYAKVDKQKQKQDRLEAKMGGKSGDAEKEIHDFVQGKEGIKINHKGTVAVSLGCSVEEHEYETLPRKKDETEPEDLYEEVETKGDAKPAQTIAHV